MKSTGYLLLQQNERNGINGAFQELRNAEELLDVTLACEDETLEAHKVVLSASSSFFRGVFKKTKQSHPFIYLSGVLYKDLSALLDYIYTGETQIVAEDVDRFIEVGRQLKVKGLFEDEDDDKAEDTNNSGEKTVGKKKKVEEEILTPEVIIKEPKLKNDNKEVPEFEWEDSGNSSMDETLDNSTNIKKEKMGESKDLEQLLAEISARMEKVPDEGGVLVWKCTECGKISKKKDKISTHVEIHLEGFSHKCSHCDMTKKTRAALQQHVYAHHKDQV